jgi:hypothetical protein
MQQLNLIRNQKSITIIDFSDEEYKSYVEFRTEVKNIYKQLNSYLINIKNINKTDDRRKLNNMYDNFRLGTTYTECDDDHSSRIVYEMCVYNRLKFHGLEVNISEQVRTFHVLNSILNGNHISKIDKTFWDARSHQKGHRFLLLSHMVKFLNDELDIKPGYFISVLCPISELKISSLLSTED